MVKKVLCGAGFVEDETFRETRFLKPPKETYAIYLHAYTRGGADGLNLVKYCEDTIELYSYKPDPAAEARLEKSFDDLGLEYEKSERMWIDEEQLYEVVYSFSYTEK